MKKREFEALAKCLQTELPDFTVKGKLMFIEPVKHVLRAVVLESSGWEADWFYINVIAQPLFVPAEHVVLTPGWRVGGGCHTWDRRSPELLKELARALKREAVPFLACIESPGDIVEAARAIGVKKPGEGIPYVQEAVAYGLAFDGKTSQAIKWLDTLLTSLDISIPWQRETTERATLVKHHLLSDPAEARRQLETWEEYTAKHLRLEQYR